MSVDHIPCFLKKLGVVANFQEACFLVVMSLELDEEAEGRIKGFKVDLHCHILPKRWPDLKEVISRFLTH